MVVMMMYVGSLRSLGDTARRRVTQMERERARGRWRQKTESERGGRRKQNKKFHGFLLSEGSFQVCRFDQRSSYYRLLGFSATSAVVA